MLIAFYFLPLVLLLVMLTLCFSKTVGGMDLSAAKTNGMNLCLILSYLCIFFDLWMFGLPLVAGVFMNGDRIDLLLIPCVILLFVSTKYRSRPGLFTGLVFGAVGLFYLHLYLFTHFGEWKNSANSAFFFHCAVFLKICSISSSISSEQSSEETPEESFSSTVAPGQD